MNKQTEKIWNEFNAKLKQFIRKRVPNEDIAQDILQEVFLKIHSRIGTLRDNSKLQSWVYQITRNTIADHYRSHKPVFEIKKEPALQEEAVDAEPRAELCECIKDLVNNLPDKYQEALTLIEYQGLNQRELAEKLSLSLPGAKSRVQRARSKLKEMLLADCHHQLVQMGIAVDYQPCCKCCCENKIS